MLEQRHLLVRHAGVPKGPLRRGGQLGTAEGETGPSEELVRLGQCYCETESYF